MKQNYYSDVANLLCTTIINHNGGCPTEGEWHLIKDALEEAIKTNIEDSDLQDKAVAKCIVGTFMELMSDLMQYNNQQK